MLEDKKPSKPKQIECVLLRAIGSNKGTLKKGTKHKCSESEYQDLKLKRAV